MRQTQSKRTRIILVLIAIFQCNLRSDEGAGEILRLTAIPPNGYSWGAANRKLQADASINEKETRVSITLRNTVVPKEVCMIVIRKQGAERVFTITNIFSIVFDPGGDDGWELTENGAMGRRTLKPGKHRFIFKKKSERANQK
jgi:hypothetical protein